MKFGEKFKVLGVRTAVGKTTPSRTYYNVDLRLGDYNYSFSCTEDAARVLQSVPFGEEHLLEFDYFPQNVTGFYGLGRLRVCGVVK